MTYTELKTKVPTASISNGVAGELVHFNVFGCRFTARRVDDRLICVRLAGAIDLDRLIDAAGADPQHADGAPA